MGVLKSLAEWLGVSRPAKPVEAARSAPPTPARPVHVDLYTEDDDAMLDGAPGAEGGAPTLSPAPKNRQELLNELRKNYTEVLGLVRKVDAHLDEQSDRAGRLIELGERTARHAEALPELVEQNRRIADALGELVALTRESRESQESSAERLNRTALQQLEASQHQTGALQAMQAAIHRAGEAEAETTRVMQGFGQTLGELSGSTRELGVSISTMRETDAEREAELSRLVAGSQRWLVAAVVLTGLLAVGVLAMMLNRAM